MFLVVEDEVHQLINPIVHVVRSSMRWMKLGRTKGILKRWKRVDDNKIFMRLLEMSFLLVELN